VDTTLPFLLRCLSNGKRPFLVGTLIADALSWDLYSNTERAMRAAVLVLTVSLLPMTAKAADMPAAAPSPSASIWTGAYFGVNFGYAFGGSTKQISLLNQRATNFDSINGVIAGGQLGVDYQMSNIVVGLGADYNKSWAANNFEGFEFPGAAKLSHEYVGTFRGRVGYVFGSQVLAYGTAGVAVSN